MSQAIYLAADVPHAYVSGELVECMATSNVCRLFVTPRDPAMPCRRPSTWRPTCRTRTCRASWWSAWPRQLQVIRNPQRPCHAVSQAIYLAANVPHAYVSGELVECMATSVAGYL